MNEQKNEYWSYLCLNFTFLIRLTINNKLQTEQSSPTCPDKIRGRSVPLTSELPSMVPPPLVSPWLPYPCTNPLPVHRPRSGVTQQPVTARGATVHGVNLDGFLAGWGKKVRSPKKSLTVRWRRVLAWRWLIWAQRRPAAGTQEVLTSPRRPLHRRGPGDGVRAWPWHTADPTPAQRRYDTVRTERNRKTRHT